MAYPSRDNRGASRGGRGGFGGGRDFGRDRERPQMHSAICANCGKEAQVPFRPTGSRPVYCSDCFEKMQGSEPRNFDRRDSGDNRDRAPRPSQAPSNQQLDAINTKLDKILNLLSNTKAKGAEQTSGEQSRRAKVIEDEVTQLVKTAQAEKAQAVEELGVTVKKRRAPKKIVTEEFQAPVQETPAEAPSEETSENI